mmetsp:Transcript_20798/g.19820  ORF Transcript_20798/g.19820 Transcript_20798/m.19820 type:complete len:222 (+) Transcript_20798:163-828(+)
MEKLDDRLRQMSLNYSDLFTQFTITQLKIEPAFEMVNNVETFIDKYLPFLIHLHIADSLQDVLSNQQKARFLEYDRRKIAEIKAFTSNRSLSSQQRTRGIVKLFNKRLHCFLQFLSSRGQGSIRFEYGRDWRVDMPEEQIDYLDKGYQIILDQKVDYLSKYSVDSSHANSRRQSLEKNPQTQTFQRGMTKFNMTISSEVEELEKKDKRDQQRLAYFTQFRE